MPKYVLERDPPGAGAFSNDDMSAIDEKRGGRDDA